MSELHDLYQEVILDHNKRPRNFRAIPGAQHVARGHNPLCGDQITVYVTLRGDVVEDVAFEGAGCAISTASASLMTESIKNKTSGEARQLFERFHDLVTGAPGQDSAGRLGKLAVFSGVSEFPVRVKCATLAWHTLNAALEGSSAELVTTE